MEELGQRISSHELSEWMAYEKVDGPIGDERNDYMSAVIAATFANIYRGKHKPAHALYDFMPFHSAERQEVNEKKRIEGLRKAQRQREAMERGRDNRKPKS